MVSCYKCLENTLSFEEFPDDFVRATCNFCGNTNEWQKKKKILVAGDLCRHCGTSVIEQVSRGLSPKKLKRAYHYCKWLRCPKCRAFYMLDQWKRFPGQDCDCPPSISSNFTHSSAAYFFESSMILVTHNVRRFVPSSLLISHAS